MALARKSREDISGPQERKIIYGESEMIMGGLKLLDVSYFSQWTGFEHDCTVHTVTEDTIKNAYAAGRSLPNYVQAVTPKCVDVIEVKGERNVNLGEHYIANKDAIIDTSAYQVLHRQEITDMFSGMDENENVYIKGNTSTCQERTRRKRQKMWVRLDNPPRHNSRVNATVEGSIIRFGSYGVKLYTQDGLISDPNDVWPNRNSNIHDLTKGPVVVGAGICTNIKTIEWFELGTVEWKPCEPDLAPQKEDIMEPHQRRKIRKYEKKPDNKYRDFMKTAYDAGWVATYQSAEPNKTPLGLGETFWSYVKLPTWKNVATDLVEHIKKRKIDPISTGIENTPLNRITPPTYGLIVKKLEQNGLGLRSAQEDALSLMFKDGKMRSGIYILPCGAGKTLLGIAAATRRGGSTLVIVPNETIANQWREAFVRRANVWPVTSKRIARIRGKEADRVLFGENACPVVIRSVNELAFDKKTGKGVRTNSFKITSQERIEYYKWDLIIIDEIHGIRTDDKKKMLNKLSYTTLIGLTATLVESKEKDDGNPPWFVNIAPIMYETAWPVRNAKIIEVPCSHPLDLTYEQKTNEQIEIIKQNLATEHGGNIYSDNNSYSWNLAMNPYKIHRLREIISKHEGKNEPIAVFSTRLPFIDWINRVIIKAQPGIKRTYFMDFLKMKFHQYKEQLRSKIKVYTATGEPIFQDEWIHMKEGSEWFERKPTEAESSQRIEEEEAAFKDLTQKKITEETYYELLYILQPERMYATGTTEQKYRNIMYREFRKGTIKTLIQSKIGDTGVDIPNCRVVISAAFNGASKSEAAQQFGRGLRDGDDLNAGHRYYYAMYTDLGGNGPLNVEKKQAQDRLTFLKSRGYQTEGKEEVYTGFHFQPGIQQDNDGAYIIDDTFYMTPNRKDILQKALKKGQVTLKIRVNGLWEETCTIRGQEAHIKKIQIHENNILMAEYILKHLDISLKIECQDGIFDVEVVVTSEVDETSMSDVDSEVEDAMSEVEDAMSEVDDATNAVEDATNAVDDATSEDGDAMSEDKDAMSEVEDAMSEVDDAMSEVEDAMSEVEDATNGNEDVDSSDEDATNGNEDVDSSDEDDDRSFSDSSEAPGGQVDRLLVLLGLGQEYHNRVYTELSNNRHNFNKTLEKLSGIPMFVRSLIGSNDITPYGGRLSSVVNALRQYGFSVAKVLFGVFQIDDTDIIGYIYGDDNALYGVERRSITERELINKTRGYDVYIVRNPYT